MYFGLGRLGFSPREFWAATLRELVAASLQGSGPPGTGDLAALMRAFPDQVNEKRPFHDRI